MTSSELESKRITRDEEQPVGQRLAWAAVFPVVTLAIGAYLTALIFQDAPLLRESAKQVIGGCFLFIVLIFLFFAGRFFAALENYRTREEETESLPTTTRRKADREECDVHPR